MARLSRLMGLGILGIALVVGVGTSGDTKTDKDAPKKESGKKAPGLPAGWKALKLSKEQRAKVDGIRAEYKVKIVELEKKIESTRAAERAEMIAVLTDDQKAQLLKGLTGETKDKDKAVPKQKDDKK